MSETTTKRQLCRLNRFDRRRLEDWVRDNIDRMRAERLTQAQGAAEAVAALGIPMLTAANIRGALTALGLEWQPIPVPQSIEDRLTAQEEKIAVLEALVTRLQRMVEPKTAGLFLAPSATQ